jgi:hypothetical protein
MAGDITLNPGSGGATVSTLQDASAVQWPNATVVYATSTTQGSATFQYVSTTAGLPVAQQGTWTVGISGTVPVSGTFWQATQPVSGTVTANQGGTWTVTANAGTNLNTSLLALESGGNLASINTKVPALGQALAAASVPVVLTAAQLTTLTTVAANQSGTWTNTVTQATAANLNATVVGTGTFAVQAAQSGTWNVGTVTTLTGITNALPAGTNLLGSIAESPQIATAYNGTTAATVKYASFSTSSSGATTIVSAVGGQKVYVLRWSVSSNGGTNVNLQSHTTTSNCTGTRYLTQYASAGGAYCPLGIMATTTGEALDVNNSNAIAISGEITYVQF